MPFDAVTTFAPLSGNPFQLFPTATQQQLPPYVTTSFMQSLGNRFTQFSVTSTAALVEAAKTRNSMELLVPVDQQPGIFDNAIPTSSQSGFIVNPGSHLVLAPYVDPMYAVALGMPSIIFFMDT